MSGPTTSRAISSRRTSSSTSAADLELDQLEAVVDGLAAEARELLVVVAEPARRGGVRRIARGEQLLAPGGAPGLRGAQDLERLVARERVGQVAEVDEVDELLGAHRRQQLPQRQAGALGLQVPQRVDHRADGHVHDALLGAEPAQLRVVDELPPHGAHVGQQLVGVAAHEPLAERLDGGHLDVVAAPDREDEAVPGVPGVRRHPHVGRGVVRVRVHGVRPVERQRRREPDVGGLEVGDQEAKNSGRQV